MNLSARERMILIVVALVIGAFAFDYVVLEPMLERLRDADSRLSEAQGKLNDATQADANLLVARRNWARIAGASLMTDPSQAEGQLLNKVTSYAQAAGLGTPGSLRPEREEKEKDFQRITVRATVNGTMDQLSHFLFALKNADIPLRVNDVQITPRKEGSDDLAMNIGVSTIYIPPRTDAGTTGNGSGNGSGGSGGNANAPANGNTAGVR